MEFNSIKDIKEQIGVAVEELDRPKCFRLVSLLRASDIGKKYRTQDAESYAELLGQAEALILYRLTNKEVSDFFQSRVQGALRNTDINLIESLRSKLELIFTEERIEQRRLFMNSLEKNSHRLFSSNQKNSKQTPDTVQEWLADYRKVVGGSLPSDIERVDYLTNSQNVKSLNQSERQIIRRLIDLYDVLKFSGDESEIIDNIELFQDDQNFYAISAGIAYQLGVNAEKTKTSELVSVSNEQATTEEESSRQEMSSPQTSEEQEILAAYRGPESDREAIAKEQEKLRKKYGQKLDAYGDALIEAVQKNKPHRAIAALYSLAEMSYLMPYVVNNKKLAQQLKVVWQQKHGKKFAEGFDKQSAQPEYVRALLQYILEDRLKLDHHFAAWVGAQISNIFVRQGKKEYNTIAYFDVKDKKFEWFES